MSFNEGLFSELIAMLREQLANLKQEEQSLLSGDFQLASKFNTEYQELKNKIRSLKFKLKKETISPVEDEVEKASWIEQKESLEKKIKEITKANKKISPPSQTPLPMKEPEAPKKKKPLLLEEENQQGESS